MGATPPERHKKMAAVMVPEAAQQRSEHRASAKVIRANAGLNPALRTTAVAELGAAARRLRQSNRWNESAPLKTNRPVAPVAPIRVVAGEIDRAAVNESVQAAATKRVHPAGANLPKRLRLV